MMKRGIEEAEKSVGGSLRIEERQRECRRGGRGEVNG